MRTHGKKKGLLYTATSLALLVVAIAFMSSRISSASNNLQSIALSPQVTSPTCLPGLIFYSSTTNQFMACTSTGTPMAFVTNLSGGSQLNAAYITQGTFGSGAVGSNSQYLFRPATDNTGMLQVLNASGTMAVFDVDTLNQRVGIGTAAPSSTLTVNGTITLTGASSTITGLAAPVNASDAATKAYVDAASGGAYSKSQMFTSSGTFTVPSGVSMVWVTLQGGGGGGGGGGNANGAYGYGAGGGGGGQFILRMPYNVSLGQDISVVVGAGGAGGTGTSAVNFGSGGGNGGSSQFGSLIAYGGGGGSGSGGGGGPTGVTGGSSANKVSGAAGGSGCAGQCYGNTGGSVPGAMPGGAAGSSYGAGGGGGASYSGQGGAGGAGTSCTAGSAGSGYGAGGGGGGGVNSGTGCNGGAGSSGFVLVEWISP